MSYNDTFLTIGEVAVRLRVHWQTVRSYIKSGKLRSTKVGRNVRIKESDLQSFIYGQQNNQELYEVEIRFLTKRRKIIERNLISSKAKVVYHGHVIDHWYVPNNIKNIQQKNKSFESAKGFGLRIREQDNGYTGKIVTSLEVKKLFEPDHHDTCLEQEVEVPDFEQTHKLLRLMNFKKMITVDKDRLIYDLSGYKIVIDDIRNYKTGIEIETKTHTPKTVIPKLKKVAKRIGLDHKEELVDKSVTYLAMEKFAKF
ncbi:excisionase family DNA-binding protein [Patescibacteria group bacterium]